MILLPYVYTTTIVNGIHVHSYMILTIGGTTLWSEEIDHSEIESTLAANDLYTDSIQNKDGVVLCAIDRQKTTLHDFYKWSEITDPSTFCWRTFYTFGEKQNWLPHPHETISGYSYQTLCSMILLDTI